MAAAATPVGPLPDVNSAAIAWFRMLIAVFLYKSELCKPMEMQAVNLILIL